jgi:hypothetical protein
MDVDPAASLRIWGVEIELGGRTFEVPALPAADWLPVLMTADPLRVIELIPSSPGDSSVEDTILAGGVSTDDLVNAFTTAIEEVTGRPCYAAWVLAIAAQDRWSVVGGELARRGFRWDEQPIGAALDAIYVTIVERIKPDDLPRFYALMERPAAGAVRPADRDRALREFEQVAGPKPEGVRSSGERSGSARPKTRPRSQRHRQDGT